MTFRAARRLSLEACRLALMHSFYSILPATYTRSNMPGATTLMSMDNRKLRDYSPSHCLQIFPIYIRMLLTCMNATEL